MQLKPFINEYNELVIPFYSLKKYHYWNGGIDIGEILKELNASEKVYNKYKGGL